MHAGTANREAVRWPPCTRPTGDVLTGEPTCFILAETLVLAGTAGVSGMAPPTSTRISARLKFVQGHVSPGSVSGHSRVLPQPDSGAARPAKRAKTSSKGVPIQVVLYVCNHYSRFTLL